MIVPRMPFTPRVGPRFSRPAVSRRKPETALRDLCEAYYGPVEAFVRRYRSGHDDARDLTHAFFAKLLEGNSLGGIERDARSVPLVPAGSGQAFPGRPTQIAGWPRNGEAANRSSHSTRARVTAGPGNDAHAPLDVADPHGFPPDSFFDHQWALAIVEKAMSGLRAESRGPWRDAAVRGSEAMAHRFRGPRRGDRGGPFAGHDRRGIQGRRPSPAEAIPPARQGPDCLHRRRSGSAPGELDYLIQALIVSQAGSETIQQERGRG